MDTRPDEVVSAVNMHTPSFKWEWNLNTVAILIGFAAGLVTWGSTMSIWTQNTEKIMRLEEQVKSISENTAKIGQLEYRMTTTEATNRLQDERMDRFADIITSLRQSLAEISTDVKVVSSKADGIAETLKERNRTRFQDQYSKPN